jgi:hypothetical protein
LDPWYGDILIYLQTLKLSQHLSRDDRRCIRHQAKNYLIIDDTLYRRGVDNILRHCLTHEEAESVLNDCHSGACGGHLSGLRQPKKYCEPVIFGHQFLKIVLKRSRSVTLSRCSLGKCAHTQPLFTQSSPSVPSPSGGYILWTVTQASAGGHQHIIVAMDYFTKWAEAMPTIKSDGKTATFFVFNQIIAWFRIPREIVTDHGSHFQNEMMKELASKLGFKHGHSSPYYPQENGQVEVVNKSLKTILQKTVSQSKSDWHLMLYPALWAYRTSVKTSTGFSPFQLVHGVESILPIECEIPSLKLEIELLPDTSDLEECLVHLECLDEQRRDASMTIEVNK